jgi:hypothetical protein
MRESYESLNKAWKSTCKTVLGGEIGELKDYGEWLSEHMDPFKVKKSCISDSDVYCAVPYYCEDGKFVSLKDLDFNKKYGALNINEIKDIDSIAQALKERLIYCGNVILGNSKYISKSSNVANSFHVYHSNFVSDSEHNAYCSNTRRSRYCFGINHDVGSNYVIRQFEGHNNSRCFENWMCLTNSDVYCCFGVWNSADVMFSFNLDNKRNVIGNVELSKEKYASIKSKLLEEIREDLEKNKRMKSLMDMIVEDSRLPKITQELDETEDYSIGDKAPIEEEFSKTSRIILGRGLQGIDDHEKWLMKYIPKVDSLKSVVSGKQLFKSHHMPYYVLPKSKLVKQREARQLAKELKLEMEDIECVEKLRKSIWKIALVFSEGYLGKRRNVFGIPIFNTSINCYKGPVFAFNENSAFCYWPRESKNMFGSALAHNSDFCINAYYSDNLTRAFEVDGCSNSSDIYFSHNCENVKDSMFCFNGKNLRNAIGNAQYAPDEYKQVKTSVLEQIVSEIESKKELKWDIFNIGGKFSP